MKIKSKTHALTLPPMKKCTTPLSGPVRTPGVTHIKFKKHSMRFPDLVEFRRSTFFQCALNFSSSGMRIFFNGGGYLRQIHNRGIQLWAHETAVICPQTIYLSTSSFRICIPHKMFHKRNESKPNHQQKIAIDHDSRTACSVTVWGACRVNMYEVKAPRTTPPYERKKIKTRIKASRRPHPHRRRSLAFLELRLFPLPHESLQLLCQARSLPHCLQLSLQHLMLGFVSTRRSLCS
jgi:hypothetical protein